MRIRPAIRRGLDELEDVEDDAGSLFATIGMDFSNVVPTSRQARHWDAFDEGVILVADVANAGLAGFIAVEPLDDGAHVQELSVRRANQGRGLGRRLMGEAERWAREQGYPSLTLTTFRDVPWNAPFYASHGFIEVPPDAMPPGLKGARAEETSRGLDRVGHRVAMRKSLV